MNRTQTITARYLENSGLQGDELLLEALLRRGFLAYKADGIIYLGTGSHPSDVDVLRFLPGLLIAPITKDPECVARLGLAESSISAMEVAKAIISLPENHRNNHSLWTTGGIGPWVKCSWDQYRLMAWGAKLAVCPMKHEGQNQVENALDIGVALLVKTLPLARVATTFSCDGHGSKPARISLHHEFDPVWGNAVFDVLAIEHPYSIWTWSSSDGNSLSIQPVDGFGNVAVLNMLNDIQTFSRALLDSGTIQRIGQARKATLEAFVDWGHSPPADYFSSVARQMLHA